MIVCAIHGETRHVLFCFFFCSSPLQIYPVSAVVMPLHYLLQFRGVIRRGLVLRPGFSHASWKNRAACLAGGYLSPLSGEGPDSHPNPTTHPLPLTHPHAHPQPIKVSL